VLTLQQSSNMGYVDMEALADKEGWPYDDKD
jgi:hypothetical protein